MSLTAQIKLATLEAGMPTELADKIKDNMDLANLPVMELEELLHLAKTRPPSVLVWGFMYWPQTTEGFEFWSRHAHNLEEAEYNSAKTESV